MRSWDQIFCENVVILKQRHRQIRYLQYSQNTLFQSLFLGALHQKSQIAGSELIQ